MSKFLRIVVSALAGLAGAIVFVPGVALASLSADVNFSLPDTTFQVGDTDVDVVLSITNDNDGVESTLTNTVCATAQSNPPCDEAGVGSPADDKGINFIMSCGSPGLTVCGAVGADPGVFQAEASGTGGDACAGRTFTIIESDPTFGTLRFVPSGATPITLAPGATCTISFQVDVVGMPTIDQDPATPLVQTGQIADVLMYSGSLDAYDSDSSNLTIVRATPTIETQASPTVALGATISDTAFVSDRAFPEATADVRFDLYGPNNPNCVGDPVFTSTVPISDVETNVTSEAFSPTAQGTYRWIATYEGDANNEPVAGACNDANESVVVTQAAPTIVTTASADTVLGGEALTDTATVSGRVGAVAESNVVFRLYGPDDATCATTPVFESIVPLPVDSDVVTSGEYTPTAPGTYRWIAEYAGDVNNLAAAGECNDEGESTVVERAQPVLTTDAGDDVTIGDDLSDTATVTGRVSPLDSTIDFAVYGPDDDDCSGEPVFESIGNALAAADSTVTSPTFTPAIAGTYRWVATYNGDTNNAPAVGECGDPTETVEVLRATPTITTEASPGVTAGQGQVFDRATVTGRIQPVEGGTIDFRLYGPGDTDCTGLPVFQSIGVPYPVDGGTVQSASFTPIVVGTHRWVATYSGDANNEPAVGVCGDPSEIVEVALDPNVELPATGSETDLLLRSAAGLSFAGAALMLFGRRRRPLAAH